MTMVFGFDIDGVLCDTESSLLLGCIRAGFVPKGTRLEDIHGRLEEQFDISFEDIHDVLNLDLYRHIVPYWHVIADIRRWIDDGEEIVYCTARSDMQTPGVQDLTKESLDHWGIFENSLGVHFMKSRDKHLLVRDYPIISFTDDYDVVLDSMEGVVPHLFLMQANINRTCTHRRRMPWEDISRMIDYLRSGKSVESARSAQA